MRRRLLLAAGLCAVAAAAVWAAAFHVAAVQSADLRLLERLYGLGGLRGTLLARDVTQFFDPAPYALLSAALVGGAAALGRRRQARVAAVLLAGSAVTTQLLKHALAEQRAFPPWHYLPAASWPSGHTTAVASLALALVIVAPPARRRLVALFGVLLTATTGFSLLVLGSHYPTDVLGGVIVASGGPAWPAWRCPSAQRPRPGSHSGSAPPAATLRPRERMNSRSESRFR
jgi:membrane-associated phospholipid phosphatase